MRILGVDPGLRITGYGVIEVRKGTAGDIKLIEMGVIRTPAKAGIAARLATVHGGLTDAIRDLKPEVLVIEKLYAHYKHPATAILMGHVRGVVCLLSATHELKLVSMPPTHVKKVVTGHGHAGKLQVQEMVRHTLSLKKLPEPPDVADALAIAISYVFEMKQGQR